MMYVSLSILSPPLTNFFQGIWLPELAALFEDVRKIAPGDAYDVIG
jgi:THO complex subunit 2